MSIRVGFDILQKHLGASQRDLDLLARINAASESGASTEQITKLVQQSGLTGEEFARLCGDVALVSGAMERTRQR